jgi:hypothetical protein
LEIDNISIRDYFALQDTTAYDVFIDCMNPRNDFAGKSCNVSKLTFDEVEFMKGVFREPTFDNIKELFIHLFNIKGCIKRSAIDQYLSTSIFDLFRAKTFFQNFIKEIIDKEILQFSESDYKMDLLNAGERLRPFNHLLTKIRLAEQFSTTPSEIGGWKYSNTFTILVAIKAREDILEEYSQIK